MSLCLNFYFLKKKSNSCSNTPLGCGEARMAGGKRHLEQGLHGTLLRASKISVSHKSASSNNGLFCHKENKWLLHYREGPILFSPHLAISTTYTVFCFFNLVFGRPIGLAYRRFICAAFFCRSFRPFFLGRHI